MKDYYSETVLGRGQDVIFNQNLDFDLNIAEYQSEQKLDQLKSDVRQHMKMLERYNSQNLSSQQHIEGKGPDPLNPIRRVDYNQHNVNVLESLLIFLNQLPVLDENNRPASHHYREFKDCILFNIYLLNQKDIVEAILLDLKSRHILTLNSMIYCKFWIYKRHKQMLEIINERGTGELED